jgi:hypothetical protein
MIIRSLITSFALVVTLSLLTNIAIVPVQAQNASVSAIVDGEFSPQAVNSAADKTEEYVQIYGVHNAFDAIVSETALIVVEALLLFIILMFMQSLDRKLTQGIEELEVAMKTARKSKKKVV